MPKASRRADQREQQTLGEQLPDDAAPRRANRQPDPNLALTRDPAREQQVGDVRAPDHQDEAERKKERHEQQHRLGRQRDRAQPRFQDEARRPLAGTFNGIPRVPHEQLRERLVARQIGLQPADDVEAAGPFASLLAGAELVKERKRRPEVRRRDGLESSKAFRHHADNLERCPVHPDRAVEHAGVARIVLRPGPMAEDNDRRTARFVVRGRERPPTLGAGAEDAEEVPRDETALPPDALDPGRHV